MLKVLVLPMLIYATFEKNEDSILPVLGLPGYTPLGIVMTLPSGPRFFSVCQVNLGESSKITFYINITC